MVRVLFLTLALWMPFAAGAVPMTLIYDRAQPAYYQTVARHFLDWFEKRTGQSVRGSLSGEEKKYVEECLSHLTDWSYHMNPETYWNRLRVTLTLRQGRLLAHRLAVGPSIWDASAQKRAAAVLVRKKIKLPKGYAWKDVLWLEWDLDSGDFSIYLKDKLAADPLLAAHSEYEGNILKQFLFAKNGKRSTRTLASRKEIPMDVKRKYIFYPALTDVVDILEAGQIKDQIFELRSFDDRFMDEPIRSVANDIDSDFRILADSMIYRSHQDMEIYYP